ncbi:hypothetical protein GRAN_3076 [Granulicella sibirica]|uniref:Uncharacterized protein n=1 Tax=Granulicella sibirica TaxID=2479048 RepID=A0A4Q0T2S1_9BACT|nr:hypothetical protein GRAN_3076 [Granulicella sibirica]
MLDRSARTGAAFRQGTVERTAHKEAVKNDQENEEDHGRYGTEHKITELIQN